VREREWERGFGFGDKIYPSHTFPVLPRSYSSAQHVLTRARLEINTG